MRYTAPKLIATFAATSAIQSEKSVLPFEIQDASLTNPPAYNSAE